MRERRRRRCRWTGAGAAGAVLARWSYQRGVFDGLTLLALVLIAGVALVFWLDDQTEREVRR